MLPRTATEQYREQQRLVAVTTASVGKLWRRVGVEFGAWYDVRGQVLNVAQAGRRAAVAAALPYTGAVLAETGQVASPWGGLDPARFTATAPDGRDLGSLLDEAPIRARTAVKGGATAAEAAASAGSWLTGTLLTVMADTRRAVYQADIIQRPTITGYVRMLNPPSCSRCAILAGKWFRWNQGFQRHPRCDCQHIPASEQVAGDLTTDPYKYFESLDAKTQDRLFGRNDAQAIRDGGDINRVVNIRTRGLGTSKQAAKYGTPSRLTIDDIYMRATDRADAIRLMRQEGFILPQGQAPGGAIVGPRRERFAGMSRGRGTYTVGGVQVKTARASVVDARTTGLRDPLNRATMTAGERRINDAYVRAEDALRGVRRRTIAANSADRGITFDALDPDRADAVRMSFIRIVDKARERGTSSEKRLAELLWARYDALV